MTDIEKLRLAIYEDKSLSESDRNILLEATDEKVSENKVYIDAYKKAAFQYKKDIKDIKSLIKEKELRKAYKKVKETRDNLNDLEKVVKEIPATLSGTIVAKLAQITKATLFYMGLSKAFEPAYKSIKKYYDDNLKEELKKELPKDSKIPTDLPDPKKGKELVKSSLVDSVADVAISDAFKMVKNKGNYADTNMFKTAVLKKITKEKKLLDKLEREIMRAIK